MKKHTSLYIILFLCLSTATAQAQFAKPLKPRTSTAESDAKYNIGVVGGLSATRWLHFGGTETTYEQPYFLYSADNAFASLLDHGLAGLVFEYRLSENNSIGIEVLYANRSTMLSYNYILPDQINHSQIYYRQDSIIYKEICIQVPITQYFGNGNIKPYLFIAPRFTLPLSGDMHWKYGAVSSGTKGTTDTTTVAMTAHNMRPWNVGAVVGAGLSFKIPISSYYMFLKLDASYHWGFFNTFADKEINGDSEDVIGASYIDPTLLGKRYISNATVKLTVMFPLKKQLKGACMNWGEYD